MIQSLRILPSALAALCLLASPGAALDDPGAPGPLAVTRSEYTFGDEVFQPSDLAALQPPQRVEVTASVHYPTDLSGGPFPVVVFLHGRHVTCYSESELTTSQVWPCPAGQSPIPSYQGYDYVAEVLASHGYIVISISANGINARDDSVPDFGMLARAELLQHHLGLWQTYDARYNVPGDLGSKHIVYAMGANHNFFNTVWTPGLFPAGTRDDWLLHSVRHSDPHCGTVAGNRRLTDAQQRGLATAFLSAFFRSYLGGQNEFVPVLTGDAPPPASAMTTDVLLSYHAPDDPGRRLDVNRVLDASHLTANELDGAVTQSGLVPYDLCGGDLPQPRHCLTSETRSARQPHTAESALAQDRRGLSQLRVQWMVPTAWYQNDLPPGTRDLTRWLALQFRAGVNFETSPAGMAQDFTVRLVDGAGASAVVRVSDVSGALFFPPGQVGPVPKVFLNTVGIPLSEFTGIQLSDVRSIRFDFDQSTAGALLISDIAFSDMLDADGDGIGDRHDNCTEIKNESQVDTDLDGFGNHCDGDFNQTGTTSGADLNIWKLCFNNQPGEPGPVHDPTCMESDMNGNSTITGTDLALWKFEFNTGDGRPGPSGLACADPVSPMNNACPTSASMSGNAEQAQAMTQPHEPITEIEDAQGAMIYARDLQGRELHVHNDAAGNTLYITDENGDIVLDLR